MTKQNHTFEGNNPRILATDEFIKRNKLSLCRTSSEILKRITRDQNTGTVFYKEEGEVLLDYLSTPDAKHFFNNDYVTKLENKEIIRGVIYRIEESVQDLLDYIDFSWSRFLSEKSTSFAKLEAWMWLMGRDDIEAILDDTALYYPYGIPALIKACEELGIEVPDDVRGLVKNDIG